MYNVNNLSQWAAFRNTAFSSKLSYAQKEIHIVCIQPKENNITKFDKEKMIFIIFRVGTVWVSVEVYM